ncbi:Csu type fimbrial protein [Phyllobacterium lublinensis]|uniref:Csu type fimbrial protein n=1 Tax=Phyllobacterium lublinensis TaxID=2875708 RepID=UPI001CCF7556|nr:spore coat U domain-containing protein [Phyllobacterium sp. 2063]MBZ9653489.1 spore coat U domain-containing protein [Phyllobacterium sp. 2063]
MRSNFSMRIACAAVIAASFGFGGSAFAASKTGTLNVKLTIESGCSVFTDNANGTLNFGTWTTLSDPIEQSTTFNVSCSDATKTFDVGLDGGLNGTVAARKLALVGGTGSQTINYNLFTDGSYTKVWGVTTGSDTVRKTSTTAGSNVAFTVYGRVPAVPNFVPAAGQYSDTVKITVTTN